MFAIRPIRSIVAAGMLAVVVAVDHPGDTLAVSRAIPVAEPTPVVARIRGCLRATTRACWSRDDVRVNGITMRRVENARWQRSLLEYLSSGDAVIPHRRGTGMSAGTRAALHRGGALATTGAWHVRAVDRSSRSAAG